MSHELSARSGKSIEVRRRDLRCGQRGWPMKADIRPTQVVGEEDHEVWQRSRRRHEVRQPPASQPRAARHVVRDKFFPMEKTSLFARLFHFNNVRVAGCRKRPRLVQLLLSVTDHDPPPSPPSAHAHISCHSSTKKPQLSLREDGSQWQGRVPSQPLVKRGLSVAGQPPFCFCTRVSIISYLRRLS